MAGEQAAGVVTMQVEVPRTRAVISCRETASETYKTILINQGKVIMAGLGMAEEQAAASPCAGGCGVMGPYKAWMCGGCLISDRLSLPAFSEKDLDDTDYYSRRAMVGFGVTKEQEVRAEELGEAARTVFHKFVDYQ